MSGTNRGADHLLESCCLHPTAQPRTCWRSRSPATSATGWCARKPACACTTSSAWGAGTPWSSSRSRPRPAERIRHCRRAGACGRSTRSAPATRPQVLLTSLLDPRRYPAAELVALYHERWEQELSYDELKTELLEREEALRSRRPAAVAQELWGLLLVYNLVRLAMARAAQAAHVAPTRISFIAALHLIRDEWLWCAGATPGAIPRHLCRLRQTLTLFLHPPRRPGRRYPRAVKLKMSGYPRNRCSRVLK